MRNKDPAGEQGGEVREWSEVLPDGREVTYTAEVEEEIIQEQEDIEITGCRVLTTSSKENSHTLETVVRLAEGEIIKVTKTNSRSHSLHDCRELHFYKELPSYFIRKQFLSSHLPIIEKI